MKTNKIAGFTLMELLVVVVIIGILAIFTVPNIRNFYHKKKLDIAAKAIADSIDFSRNYAYTFKQKSFVTFNHNGSDIQIKVYGYYDDNDSRIIQTSSLPEDIVIYPLNNGNSADYPIIIFNENFYSVGKAEVLNPSYFSTSEYGNYAPVITVTYSPPADPVLAQSKDKYNTIQFFSQTGNIKTYNQGYETTIYFQ